MARSGRYRSSFRRTATLALAALLLAGAAGAATDPDLDEREALLDVQRTLQNRVAVLRSEQDQLLFLKTLYELESKYLIIDREARSLQLRYKGRVLKDIPFRTADDGPLGNLRPGVLALTQKIEGKGDRHALVFGSDLVLASKAPSQSNQGGRTTLLLSRKDLLSVLSALEVGARAYLSR